MSQLVNPTAKLRIEGGGGAERDPSSRKCRIPTGHGVTRLPWLICCPLNHMVQQCWSAGRAAGETACFVLFVFLLICYYSRFVALAILMLSTAISPWYTTTIFRFFSNHLPSITLSFSSCTAQLTPRLNVAAVLSECRCFICTLKTETSFSESSAEIFLGLIYEVLTFSMFTNSLSANPERRNQKSPSLLTTSDCFCLPCLAL